MGNKCSHGISGSGLFGVIGRAGANRCQSDRDHTYVTVLQCQCVSGRSCNHCNGKGVIYHTSNCKFCRSHCNGEETHKKQLLNDVSRLVKSATTKVSNTKNAEIASLKTQIVELKLQLK
eukprot:69308_1